MRAATGLSRRPNIRSAAAVTRYRQAKGARWRLRSSRLVSETTARYRDYWLFLYLCNGINVADFVKLRYRDIVDGEICFVRQKTERTTKTRKEIRAVITERMQAIIDRWGNRKAADNFIFPILDGTEDAAQRHAKTIAAAGSINVRMRTIGQALGIGNISTYTARHSFATVLKRAGANRR